MSELEIELEEQPKQPPLPVPKKSVSISDSNQSNQEERQLAQRDLTSDRDHTSRNNQTDITTPTRKSGISGAVVNFVNSIIGAGIIGLPSALHKSGLIFGVFLMFMVALMIDYGVRHLVACGVKVRKKTYEETMQYAFGNKGFYICSIAKFGFAYGAMIAYHVVIGDTIPPIFQNLYPDSVLCNRSLVVCLYSVLFMLPLSLLRNMASLDKTSSLSIASVVVIVITVTVEATKHTQFNGIGDLSSGQLWINEQWFAGAGVMAFAFVCHHSSFLVYNSLKKNTPRRWVITTHLSLAISLFWSLWLALVGFINFQTETKGDVLNNFGWQNTSINFARGLLALTMVFTFPMENFVARHSLIQMVTLNRTINNEKVWFYGITLLLWGSSLAIGASITDLGVVLEIVGVLCGATIGFILPGLVSLRIFGWNSLKNAFVESFKQNKKWKEKYIASWNFLFPQFMMAFGITICIMGMATEIMQA